MQDIFAWRIGGEFGNVWRIAVRNDPIMNNSTDASNEPESANPRARSWRARQEGYNKTGANYDNLYGSHLGRAYHRRRCEILNSVVEEHFSVKNQLDLLEVGCGPGMTLEFLCERTEHRIFAFDFSSAMIGRAAAHTATLDNRPSLMLANALELPFDDNSFDIVYATRFIHQFPHEDKIRIAREVSRVLRPGGLVLLEFYARSINLLNYYFRRGEADIYSPIEEHLSHYSSRREVRDIVGQNYRIVGLQFFGDRVMNRVLGYCALSWLNACVTAVPLLRWLMNEHWVIYTPMAEGALDSPVAANVTLSLFEKVRCPKCRGRLTHDEDVVALTYEACELVYSIVDGIPNLLSHEARSLVYGSPP